MRSSLTSALALGLLVGASILNPAAAQQSANFALNVTCLNSGCGQLLSDNYGLTATVGQTATDMVEGSIYRIWSGFITPEDFASAYTSYTRIDELKTLQNGDAVKVTGKVATTDTSDFTGFIYIEESNRSNGIRVEYSSISGSLTRDKLVTVEGIIGTTSAGERVIGNAGVTVESGPGSVKAVGMTNATLGGGNYGTPTPTGGGQYGPVGGRGTNNIGLLVRVWGTITAIGTNRVSIKDGSGVSVTVDTSGLTTQPTGFAAVTGISSLTGSTGSAERFVLAID